MFVHTYTIVSSVNYTLSFFIYFDLYTLYHIQVVKIHTHLKFLLLSYELNNRKLIVYKSHVNITIILIDQWVRYTADSKCYTYTLQYLSRLIINILNIFLFLCHIMFKTNLFYQAWLWHEIQLEYLI